MSLLDGRKILILGVANERSIAWAMAKKFKELGASVALSYLNDALKKRVVPLAESISADFTFELDVTNDEQINNLPKVVNKYWDRVDGLVHSLAFAQREDLQNPFIETSRAGFLQAMDVSAYSLLGVSRALKPLLKENSSIITMTYHGSQQVIPGYNVMGVAKAALEASTRYLAYNLGEQKIRVNAISAGPIKTLAASGVAGLRDKLKISAAKAALKQNVSQEDVAGTASYLMSDLSSGVTGEIIYVDAGLSIVGE
jgi:enoyl-[acyl-carrier protein] reductase I